jgi:hypothetical protein
MVANHTATGSSDWGSIQGVGETTHLHTVVLLPGGPTARA